MPWTPQQFKTRHNNKLTAAQAKVAARVANETLKKHGDEGRAVRAGNAAGNRAYKKRKPGALATAVSRLQRARRR